VLPSSVADTSKRSTTPAQTLPKRLPASRQQPKPTDQGQRAAQAAQTRSSHSSVEGDAAPASRQAEQREQSHPTSSAPSTRLISPSSASASNGRGETAIHRITGSGRSARRGVSGRRAPPPPQARKVAPPRKAPAAAPCSPLSVRGDPGGDVLDLEPRNEHGESKRRDCHPLCRCHQPGQKKLGTAGRLTGAAWWPSTAARGCSRRWGWACAGLPG